MDQSASHQRAVDQYGGSDLSTPSFNRPRYVKHASIHDPYDLGVADAFSLTLEGLVGAESGTQTLFFSFRTLLPARIGLRKICGNAYTNQYVGLNLRGPDGLVPLGIDGFANSSLLSPLQVASTTETVIDLGYVACGYWERGYVVNDCEAITIPGVTIGVVSDAGAPFQSPYGAVMSPGSYGFTVSSSQWPQLHFCVQLAVIPPGRLSAALESNATPVARLALAKAAGLAESRSSPSGTLVTPRLGAGVADGAAAPAGTITRISPYGT